jgi:hypothetical protein
MEQHVKYNTVLNEEKYSLIAHTHRIFTLDLLILVYNKNESFTICILHQMSLGRSNQGGWDGQDI